MKRSEVWICYLIMSAVTTCKLADAERALQILCSLFKGSQFDLLKASSMSTWINAGNVYPRCLAPSG